MNDLMTESFTSYVELKKQALKDLEAGGQIKGAEFTTTEEENLNQFFEEVGEIQSQMEDISNLLRDLQQLNLEAKYAHSTKVLRGIRDRKDSNMVSILKKAKSIKEMLASLDRSNASSRRLSGMCKEGSPVDRTRMSVTNGLRAKLRGVMNEFQTLREKIVADHKEDLKRRYYAATGEVPSEEMIERMSWEGDKALQLDVESEERHKAVVELRKSLTRLHGVFLDMAILVEEQQEPLNNIEENVAYAREYIGGGTNSLAAARAIKKRKGNAWVRYAGVLVVILLLVCLLSIFSCS